MQELLNSDFKTFKNKIGIYILYINDMKYIGSSMNIERRLRGYVRDFNKKYHHNKHVLASFLEGHIVYYSIIWLADNNITYKMLCEKERDIIWEIKPEFNIVKDPTVRHRPNKSKTIYQYDLDGNFIKFYTSIVEAGILNNLSISGIQSHLSNKFKKSLNYYWSYKKYNNISEDTNFTYVLRTIDKYDIKGNFIKSYNKLEDAAKEHLSNKTQIIKKAQISSCCRNKVLQVNNFIYQYSKLEKENNKKAIVVNIPKRYPTLYQYDVYGNFVQEYENIIIASKITKISKDSIGRQLSKICESSPLGYWSHTKYKNILKETSNDVKFIFKYDLTGNYIKHYASIKEAANDYNIGLYSSRRVAISNCCNNKSSQTNNFVYKYDTLTNLIIGS